MKTRALSIAAVAATLALAACGGNEDASEDAMADTVEMPADEAMTDAPMPAEDTAIVEDSADQTAPMADVEEEATQAAEDAQAAVDDAVAAAEESMETQ